MEPTTDTRQIIMQKSFELLLKKGFDGVAISDITVATGFSRGLLYHYFGSKEAMFVETVIKHFKETFVSDVTLASHLSITQMIDHVVERYRDVIDNALQAEGISILNYEFLLYRILRESVELTEAYDRVRKDELDGWVYALTNSFNSGELSPTIDESRIPSLAQQFVYTTNGVWMRAADPDMRSKLNDELRNALFALYSFIKK